MPFEFIWFVTENPTRQVQHCIHWWNSQVCKYSQEIYLHNSQYQLTLLIIPVCAPVGFIQIGTQSKT